jgi:division protein CdvB (Snf7/Vps24/ESCRT-III family)
MASSLVKNWDRSESRSVGQSFREAINPPGPLKPRLDAAVRAIQNQVQRLDQMGHKLADKERATFRKVVDAYQKHDQARATVYANEVSEIRKINQIISQAKLALEAIAMRIDTVEELGGLIYNLAPAISVLNAVKHSIGGIMPEAVREIGDISDVLNGILVEAQTGAYSFPTVMSSGEDTELVLKEAAALAETTTKEKLPDLPTFTAPGTASTTRE